MSSKIALIKHLFHSGFVVETRNSTLVFDYFDPRPDLNLSNKSILKEDYFKDKSNVYVFVSHSHYDHYSKDIFKWQIHNPNIKYILSDDIVLNDKKENYYFLSKYESLTLDDINIKTYGTTDLGISFLVNVDGIALYHAGDLNWWHWENDTNEAKIKEEKDFKYEVDKLIGENIDIAFVPVDSRLKSSFYLGGEYFIKTLSPKLLFPMHFKDDYNTCNRFYEKVKGLGTNIALITEKNKEFNFKK